MCAACFVCVFLCSQTIARAARTQPIASVAFAVCYWTDKYTLLRHCKRPFYDYKLMLSSVKLLPGAALMHLFIAMWTFGNSEIFAADLVTGIKYYPSDRQYGNGKSGPDLSGLTQMEKVAVLQEAEKQR